MCSSRLFRIVLALACVCAANPAGAQGSKGAQKAQDAMKAERDALRESEYDVLYPRYLEAARRLQIAETGGSIRWMTGLTSDSRARFVGDLVTVRVVESISATGTADTALDKKGSGASGVTSLFGVETKLPKWIDPTSLLGASNATEFKGGGTTKRSGDLNATVTAEVTEVLPNGYLVLSGFREIDINGDRQIVVMTGTIRPADVLPDNSILSTRVGQLRIRYFGQGLIKDNVKPGFLVRLINKIF
jgi:flagellar L-ring protein FlgH